MTKIPVVVGVFYGDEGKGTTVDFLCSERTIDYVVRFSGGPQTAHNVVLEDGTEHTFAQFGSGTLRGAGTIITKHMLVNPFNLYAEGVALEKKTGWNPFDRLLVEKDALLITPLHVKANQQREINRGKDAHGSCGEGIGETRSYALFQTPDNPITVGDMLEPYKLLNKLLELDKFFIENIPDYFFDRNDIEAVVADYVAMAGDFFSSCLKSTDEIRYMISKYRDSIVFEGSQGVLLDEWHGFHPHTTWSDVTAGKAIEVLEESGLSRKDAEIIGITRTYATRHGYGPFPTEFEDDYKWEQDYPEKHNAWGRFQGSWRAGELDIRLLRYAVEANKGIDCIALTHCDREVRPAVLEWTKAIPAPGFDKDRDYRDSVTEAVFDLDKNRDIARKTVMTGDQTTDLKILVQELESHLEAPVKIMSYGPTASDKKRID